MLAPMLYQKCRPSKVDDYVFVDDTMRDNVTQWVSNGHFPNLVLVGGPGTGKSSLARLLCNECDIENADILYVKGTIDGNIDMVRNKIEPFVSNMAHGKFRVVIIDEADMLKYDTQKSLLIIMEESMDNARFILTANYGHKIDSALYSRCKMFTIDSLDKDQYMYRVANVLTQEGIEFDFEALEFYTNKNYPDMRRIFTDIESYTVNNVLRVIEPKTEQDYQEWLKRAIALFNNRQHREAREIICSNVSYEDYELIYRLMYKNIDWWAHGDRDKRDSVLITIKDHLVADASVGDREIVLSACITHLSLIDS